MQALSALLRRKSVVIPEARVHATVEVQDLFNAGQSAKRLRVERMNEEKKNILDQVRAAYGISGEEWTSALELGKRAVTEYRQERAKEVVHCAGLPSDLLHYIQQRIEKVNLGNFVHVTQGWRASPAMIEWCIGSLFSDDGTKLEDCMVFECNLVISKFWLQVLDKEVYEAIIDHELVHLEQNSEDLEQHILKSLCKLKNNGVSWGERRERHRVLQTYLHWLEYNADQKPSLNSSDAALKMHKFLSSRWLQMELFDTGVHPATQKRKAAVEEALFTSEAEEWLEKRKVCRQCADFKKCQTNRSVEKIRQAHAIGE
eukprot:TRINITY_DN222_c0_g1_i1.p1 TRINITY_DN222_c0_g1~~TRINITY_DN222_c0_g1_i1.p1  ORF type:complete len:315 (-),score=56.62 TRINITY_DN222_c0_g1_i1:187-1131(-)